MELNFAVCYKEQLEVPLEQVQHPEQLVYSLLAGESLKSQENLVSISPVNVSRDIEKKEEIN